MNRAGRRIGIAVAALAGALVLPLVAAWVFRLAIADAIAARALHSAGMDDVSIHFVSLDFSGACANARRQGTDAAGEACATWRLRALLNGRVETVTLRNVILPVERDTGGGVRVAGFPVPTGGGTQPAGFAEPPVKRAVLEAVEMRYRGPEGAAKLALDGTFDFGTGGRFKAQAVTDGLNFGGDDGTAFAGGATAQVGLSSDGAFVLEAAAHGGLSVAGATAPEADFRITARGADWREAMTGAAPASVRATVEGALPRIPLGEGPWRDAAKGVGAALAAPQDTARAGFAAVVAYDAGAVSVSAKGGAPILSLTTNAGVEAVLRPVGDAPLAARSADGRISARVDLRLSDRGAEKASAQFSADGAPEAFDFNTSVSVTGWSFAGVDLSKALLAGAGRYENGGAHADLSVDAAVKRYVMGDIKAEDARLAGPLSVDADARGARFRTSGKCLIASLRRVSAPGLTAALPAAYACAGEGGTLAVYDPADGGSLTVDAALTAPAATAQAGDIEISGRVPTLTFAARLGFAGGAWRVDGRGAGGDMTADGLARVTRLVAAFDASGDADGMRARVTLENARLADVMEAERFSPLKLSGTATLDGDAARFDAQVAAPSGVVLGALSGRHALAAGEGGADVKIGPLTFAPKGVQPSALAPALTGIIGETTGTVSGDAALAWNAKGLTRSGASISIANVSFVGPGIAVNKTAGVNAEVHLSSLAPLATDGVQTMTVDAIAMDALSFENGVISYEIDPKGEFRILSAEWPWFGGTIGVYKAMAPLAGGVVTAPLRAENVDLGALLAFFDVDGLSGEGRLRGELPLIIEDGRARIENGLLTAAGPGVLRYQSAAANAAAASAGDSGALAFDAIKDFHYETFAARIDGPLDGDIVTQIETTGLNPVVLGGAKFVFNMRIEAPLMGLIDQARLSFDAQEQIRRAVKQKPQKPPTQP